jgi:hypothetical protein
MRNSLSPENKVGLTVAAKSTPSGLGKPVRPLIRILAALIGFVGLFGLALSAYLFVVGAPDSRFDLEAASGLLLMALFATYGTCIGIRGKAPTGFVPWK